MNIVFHYLYRDGANYKNLNSIVFSNSTNIDLAILHKILKDNLITGEYFNADEWKLPDLHFGSWDEEFDHGWHEFESIEYTDEASNSIISLNEFMELITF